MVGIRSADKLPAGLGGAWRLSGLRRWPGRRWCRLGSFAPTGQLTDRRWRSGGRFMGEWLGQRNPGGATPVRRWGCTLRRERDHNAGAGAGSAITFCLLGRVLSRIDDPEDAFDDVGRGRV